MIHCYWCEKDLSSLGEVLDWHGPAEYFCSEHCLVVALIDCGEVSWTAPYVDEEEEVGDE